MNSQEEKLSELLPQNVSKIKFWRGAYNFLELEFAITLFVLFDKFGER